MLRIIAGKWHRRELKAPSTTLTRPTLNSVKETMFNVAFHNASLGSCENKIVLDVFAGSGSLGFEALSRGARHVTFVDKNKLALSCAFNNAKALKAEDCCKFVTADARFSRIPTLTLKNSSAGEHVSESYAPEEYALEKYPSKKYAAKKYEWVLIDPPYSKGFAEPTLNNLHKQNILAPNATIILEVEKREPTEIPAPFVIVKEISQGPGRLYFLNYMV